VPLQINYLFDGDLVSDVGDRRTPGYRREWQESYRPRRMDNLWLWKVFGDVLSFGSGQLANLRVSLANQALDLRWGPGLAPRRVNREDKNVYEPSASQ
jgi:hypothetical protein